MCGIAGLISSSPSGLHASFVKHMRDALEHRGPDDWGWLAYSESDGVRRGRDVLGGDGGWEVSLVHRRLSILDLSEQGWQPLTLRGSQYFIVFNGEIYNYIELKRELEDLGHVFESSSDTEVLLASYVEWGRAALGRLVGMFAFAILDTASRHLFLARDPLGIKPLFYTCAGGGFAFASELRALVWRPLRGESRVSAQNLYSYLRWGQSLVGEETLVEGIKQVPPGHSLLVTLDSPSRVNPKRYWSPERGDRFEGSFSEAAETLRDLFVSSVSLHMRSDVPVGAALSGGVDSTAIVMAMRHLCGKDLELHTFGYCASQASLDESRWIKMASEASGAITHRVYVDGEDLWGGLEDFVREMDLPVATTSCLAQRFVFARAKKEGIKVVLGGQGADELLGGYPVHVAARLGSLIRQRRPIAALDFARRALSWPGRERVWMMAGQYVLPPFVQEGLRHFVGEPLVPGWLNASWFIERGVRFLSRRDREQSDECLSQELYETLVGTSLPVLLRHEDRNAMAFSIENRVPFVTPRMVNFCLSLPESFIISPEGETKSVFRASLRGLVPDPILDRRDKIGFVTPERHWLLGQSDRVESILESDEARAFPAINHNQVMVYWGAVQSGKKPFDARLWRIINAVVWMRLVGVSA